ncbi:MAG TPA: hypothetical protein VM791_04715 [Vicinamibacterales bacterium]|nr:hypothetical protein [Vicinamibacterales bacterium]
MTIPQRTAASDLNDILQQLPEAGSPIAAADLITTMLDAGPGVSDLVFSPGRAPQVEKHGELVQVDIPQLPVLRPEDTAAVAAHLIGRNEQALRTLKADGACDVSYSLPERSRFRVHIFRQRGSFAIVMRVIAARIPTIAELNLPATIAEAANLKNGVVLVTGPTGPANRRRSRR